MPDAFGRKEQNDSPPVQIKLPDRAASTRPKIAAQDRVIDIKSMLIGVTVFALLAFGAFLWRFHGAENILGRLDEFEFAPEEPEEEEFELKEPQQEVLQEQVEELPMEDMDDVDERPDIQITTEAVEATVQEEVIKTDSIEMTDEIDVDVTQMDILDAPEDLLEVSEEVTYQLTPIAAVSARPADMFRYEEIKPTHWRPNVSMVAAAPSPGGEFKIKPAQLGDQDAPTIGELGPASINLFGDGEYMRMMGGGGGVEARTAVDMALRWLALHQEPDGSWHGSRWNPEDAPANAVETDKDGKKLSLTGARGATGLALMALMGGGHTIRKGEYRASVLRGLEWLIKGQSPQGGLSGNMYEHAMCTIALCESFGRAPDDRVGLAARKAVDFCVKAVALDNGWRYSPRPAESDLSVTAWFIQALKAAKLARIKFDNTTFARALIFVDRCTDKGGSSDSSGTVGYQPNQGASMSMTAAAMVIRQFTGVGTKSSLLVKGGNVLKQHPPPTPKGKPTQDFYYWYYATYAMHNMGGEYRIWWNTRIRDYLLEVQSKSGHQAGSWTPERDKWGMNDGAGRVYSTALGALCLEVYYRYGEALRTFGTAPTLDDLFFQ